MPIPVLFIALLAGAQHIERRPPEPRRVEAPDTPPVSAATPRLSGHITGRLWIATCNDGHRSISQIRTNNCLGHRGIRSDRHS